VDGQGLATILAEPSPESHRRLAVVDALGNKMKRYSAKLLFQFRADLGKGRSDTMRRCEERIIVLSARGAESALRKAKRYGKSEEFDGKAEAGNPIYFEFIGVTELLELGSECERNEVWYRIVTRKLPSERRDRLIPKEDDLNAIGWERRRKNMPNRPAPGNTGIPSP
jgi:hypothetical protein